MERRKRTVRCDRMQLNRRHQAYLLLFTLSLLIFCVLFLAQLGLDQDRRCTIQFPKLLGCLLSRHEALAGGLIGAMGVILAGRLAWISTRDHVAAAQREARHAQRVTIERRLDAERRQLTKLQNVSSESELLLRKLGEHLSGATRYGDRVPHLLRPGEYLPSDRLETARLGARFSDGDNRLWAAIESIQRESDRLAAGQRRAVSERGEFDTSEVVLAFASIVQQAIPITIESQSRIVRELEAELAQARS
jgi:hypothetical protein